MYADSFQMIVFSEFLIDFQVRLEQWGLYEVLKSQCCIRNPVHSPTGDSIDYFAPSSSVKILCVPVNVPGSGDRGAASSSSVSTTVMSVWMAGVLSLYLGIFYFNRHQPNCEESRILLL